MFTNPHRKLRVTPWYRSIRWCGRRWYDPNERKIIWSAVSMALLTVLLRTLSLGFTFGHTMTLAAKEPPTFGIVGTAHDLSSQGLNHATQAAEVCIFCHTPHKSPDGINQAIPVWNHATTTAHFTMYNSQGTAGTVDAQPMGPSLACLSCHDGSLAVGALHSIPPGGGQDDYSRAQGGVNAQTGMIQGHSAIGTDLSTAHPISITYRDDLNRHLRSPGSLHEVRLYPTNVRGAKVHCASCHDPHNFGIRDGTAPFLRVTKAGSALCQSCHLF